jgi:hypothetical protein
MRGVDIIWLLIKQEEEPGDLLGSYKPPGLRSARCDVSSDDQTVILRYPGIFKGFVILQLSSESLAIQPVAGWTPVWTGGGEFE